MEEQALHPEKLAINGGIPVRKTSFPAWPRFESADIEAASAVLKSGRVNYWTGDEGRKFETEFAAHCRAPYGVALANGTVALELALGALGIGAGDEVIVTSRSFVASAGAVVLRGARAVFCDVDADSQNITAETVAPHVTARTRAILAVHLAGWPCEMDALLELAEAHDLVVIEDCAQAHGARYRGRPVGGLGSAGAFSFCQDKVMTTGGEGGMLVLKDEQLWRRAWSYKDHGKSHCAVFETEHKPGFKWLHHSVGTNWRMTEFQAAIGRRQLGRLDSWHERRTLNARALTEGLGRLPGLRIPPVPDHVEHAWYKYYAFIEPEALASGWDRDRVKSAINAEGIPCYAGSCPEIYREAAFKDSDMQPESRFPTAMNLGSTSLMFLVHPTCGQQEMDATVEGVKKVLATAVR